MEKFERSDLKIESLSGTERVVQEVMVCSWWLFMLWLIRSTGFCSNLVLNSIQSKYLPVVPVFLCSLPRSLIFYSSHFLDCRGSQQHCYALTGLSAKACKWVNGETFVMKCMKFTSSAFCQLREQIINDLSFKKKRNSTPWHERK